MRKAVRLGPLAGSTPIHLDVVLRPRDPAALGRLAAAVSSPGNPLFRHYLPPGHLAAEFGPSPEAVGEVVAELRSVGLDPAPLSPDHLTLPVFATAAGIATAFSIGFERYRFPGGRVAFANTSPPLVAGGVASEVEAVIGLDTLDAPAAIGLERPTPATRASRPTRAIVTGGPRACSAASSIASGVGAYTTDELASAYSFSGLYEGGDEGSGVTVAMLELAPDLKTDIAAYQACYGTTAAIAYAAVDGGAGRGAGGGEAALDIENVIGLAPKSKLDVYDAPDTAVGDFDAYQEIVDRDTAQVVSTSWGYCETEASSTQAENTLFQMAATQGQSIVAAAGDLGSEGCGPGALAVDDPASQPYATGVGGTELRTIDPPPLQYAWNTDGAGAGGGGISALWKMPGYQAHAPARLGVVDGYSSGSACHASAGAFCREVPDVAADADPSTGYLIYYDGGWKAIGGTSGAAPLWAGFLALVDVSPACRGAPPVGFANPALYRAAAVAYGSDFGDVTTGDNDLTHTEDGLYPALAGYDMATGLGSPVGDSLAATLCETGTPGDRVVVTNPGPQTSRVDSSVDLVVTAHDSNSSSLRYSATGLPTGLSISASGEITGEATSLGLFAVAVTATDSTGVTGTIEFVWTVVATDADIVTVTAPASVTVRRGVLVGDLQIEATDSGTSTLTYSATGLPGSLQLDSALGVISGTVTGSAGTYQVEVEATDATGANASAIFTMTVTAVDHVRVANPGTQRTDAGSAVDVRVGVSDSAGLDLYVSATGLPAGLAMSPAGIVTGTPTTVGWHVVTVRAADSNGVSASASFSWRVYSIVVTPESMPAGRATVHYSVVLEARGGTSPYTWRLVSGALPPGLSLSRASGVVAGVPKRAGSWGFVVEALDASHPALTATKSYRLVIDRDIVPP
jgi:hypothetical protein